MDDIEDFIPFDGGVHCVGDGRIFNIPPSREIQNIYSYSLQGNACLMKMFTIILAFLQGMQLFYNLCLQVIVTAYHCKENIEYSKLGK